MDLIGSVESDWLGWCVNVRWIVRDNCEIFNCEFYPGAVAKLKYLDLIDIYWRTIVRSKVKIIPKRI